MKRNKTIEHRIEMDIIPDAHDREEQLMGWYYYFECKMVGPFKAKCIIKRVTSPLEVGEVVEVLSLASENDCHHEILVNILWGGRKLAIPLVQLKGIGVAPDIKEAINDWHYWAGMEYEF